MAWVFGARVCTISEHFILGTQNYVHKGKHAWTIRRRRLSGENTWPKSYGTELCCFQAVVVYSNIFTIRNNYYNHTTITARITHTHECDVWIAICVPVFVWSAFRLPTKYLANFHGRTFYRAQRYDAIVDFKCARTVLEIPVDVEVVFVNMHQIGQQYFLGTSGTTLVIYLLYYLPAYWPVAPDFNHMCGMPCLPQFIQLYFITSSHTMVISKSWTV